MRVTRSIAHNVKFSWCATLRASEKIIQLSNVFADQIDPEAPLIGLNGVGSNPILVFRIAPVFPHLLPEAVQPPPWTTDQLRSIQIVRDYLSGVNPDLAKEFDRTYGRPFPATPNCPEFWHLSHTISNPPLHEELAIPIAHRALYAIRTIAGEQDNTQWYLAVADKEAEDGFTLANVLNHHPHEVMCEIVIYSNTKRDTSPER